MRTAFIASHLLGLLTLTAFVVPAGAQSVTYQGLTNTSVGNASVAIECCISNLGSSGQDGLVVSNLSSSGQDGVSIALPGNLTALVVTSQPLDPSNTLPVGAYVQEQIMGTANGGTAGGNTSGVLGAVTVTKECAVCDGTNYLVSADFSPIGASIYTVQAYLNGTLVAQATNRPGSSLAGCGIWPPKIDWQMNDEGSATLSVHWLSATPVALSGVGSVTCDELLITPENVHFGSPPTALQITASGVPAITITGENATLVYGGLNITSLGSAALGLIVTNLGSSGQDGLALVISNLSSSGQDGVSISLSGVQESVDMHWQPLDVSNTLPVGAYIQEHVVGTVNGGTAGGNTSGMLGAVTMTKACAICGGSNYVVSADFSPIGASTYTVQAYLNGTLVSQATNQSGAALASCSVMGDSGCIPKPPILGGGWDWTNNTLVTIGGGTSVTCDHLYIIPENVSGTATALQIVASQVPAITMDAVLVSPWLLSLSMNNQNATLQWYGTGVLQESTDLATWTDITNAVSPYGVAAPPSGGAPQKYYRLIFRP